MPVAINAQTSETSPKVRVEKKEISIRELLTEIERQTSYLFVYSQNDVNLDQKVKIRSRVQTVDELLEGALASTNVTHQISNEYISLTRRLYTRTVPLIKRAKGRVYDQQGYSLMGVLVSVRGTTRNTFTDVDGFYVINDVEPGQTLDFSLTGYKSSDKKISSTFNVDMVLNEDVQGLDEVVVVGMGSQRRASVIGSISNVETKDLKVPSRSLVNSLSGRLSGIVAVQRSGEPGYDNAQFWIRGVSTFGSNTSPLVLVDGVERSIENIDPEEVDDVSVLKDASATAVYGVRAANGIILVSTRKGLASIKPTIEVKVEQGVSQLTRMPQLLDGVDFMNLYNEAVESTFFSQEKIYGTIKGTDPYLFPNVNWFDEIFKKNSSNKNLSINVRGGGPLARYFVSFGYIDESGNLKDSPLNDYKSNISFERYNFRSNVDVSITKSTNLDLEVGGYLIDSHYPGSTTSELFNYAYMANPVNIPVQYPIYNEDGSHRDVWAGTLSVSTLNPAERLLGSGFKTEYRNQFMGQTILTQDFGQWVNGLKANLSFSFDTYSQTSQNRLKRDSYFLANGRNPDGSLELIETQIGNDFSSFSKSVWNNRAIEFKAQVNYDRLFGEDYRLGVMGMYYQRDYRDGTANENIYALPYRKQGLAVRVTWAYLDKFFTEYNMGYNGSENFPKGQRFGLFPAGAFGYLISNEDFWTQSSISKIIPVMKFRGSIGLVGAEALPDNRRFGYLTIVGDGLGGYNFGLDKKYYAGTGENQFGVRNLTWEKGLKTNIGFQSKFWDNLYLEMDYFHEKRTDILVQRKSLPAIVGTNEMPFVNMGEMKNQGVDGSIEYRGRMGKFKYKVFGNSTLTRNKILYMDEPVPKYAYLAQTGHRYGQQFGLVSLGFFKDESDVKNSPVQKFGNVRPGDIKYLDVNGDGVVDTYDKLPIGYPDIPEIVYGFGCMVEYRNYDFNIFFRGQEHVSYMLGGEGFVPFMNGGNRGNLFKEALNRWTVDHPSDDAFYPRLNSAETQNNYQPSTKWLYDGSFLRLADLELGYNFKKKEVKKINLNGLRFYFHASNLALMSSFKMWDPEIGRGSGNAYPLQRKLNIGVRANF